MALTYKCCHHRVTVAPLFIYKYPQKNSWKFSHVFSRCLTYVTDEPYVTPHNHTDTDTTAAACSPSMFIVCQHAPICWSAPKKNERLLLKLMIWVLQIFCHKPNYLTIKKTCLHSISFIPALSLGFAKGHSGECRSVRLREITQKVTCDQTTEKSQTTPCNL